jgi:hypothetical protein
MHTKIEYKTYSQQQPFFLLYYFSFGRIILFLGSCFFLYLKASSKSF